MPQGRVVRQDDVCKESFGVKGTKNLNREMLDALIDPEGPLAAGMQPAVKAATEAGAKKLAASLDDANVVARPKTKQPKEKSKDVVEVEPSSLLEWGP